MKTFASQLKKALWIDWLVLSALVFFALLAPFVMPASAVIALAPVCEWKAKYNRECPLCGMTRSFIAISQGDLGRAGRRNKGSAPLYTALVCNECVAASLVVVQWRRRQKRLWAPA